MRININIEKRYFYLILGIFIAILGFLVVNAHNSGLSPSVAGHDVLEIDWSKTIPTIRVNTFCLSGVCRSSWGTTSSGSSSGGSSSGGSSGGTCTATETCASMKMDCGTFVDNCYNTHPCGTCPSGETCNAGHCSGSSSQTTTCTPKTCSELGKTCGTFNDGCGGTVNCDSCGAGSTCNSELKKCCYTQSACSIYGFECGTWDNGCGVKYNCGTCPSGKICDKTQAKCVIDETPIKDCDPNNPECAFACTPYTSCQAQGRRCGYLWDGCKKVNCGTCTRDYPFCYNGLCSDGGPGGDGPPDLDISVMDVVENYGSSSTTISVTESSNVDSNAPSNGVIGHDPTGSEGNGMIGHDPSGTDSSGSIGSIGPADSGDIGVGATSSD